MTTQTRTARQIADDIRQWDRFEITDLTDMIDALRAALDEEWGDNDHSAQLAEYDLLDGNADALPSEPIPDDIDTEYPVWACDQQGQCLVGDWSRSGVRGNGWQIETIADIRGWQETLGDLS